MNTLMPKKLKSHFLELATLLNHKKNDRDRFIHLDCSALVVLKIVHLLLDDAALVKKMAQSLSMVFNPSDSVSNSTHDEQDLFEAFLRIDQSLDDDQRGFLALFDVVREQVSIRRDPHVLLRLMAEDKPLLALPIAHLVQMLLVYRELKMQVVTMPAQVAPCLLAMSMRDLLSCTQKDAEHSIFDWLVHRIDNKALYQLYEMAQKPPVSWISMEKDHFFVMVCVMVARHGWAKLYEMDGVALALAKFGMADGRSIPMVERKVS